MYFTTLQICWGIVLLQYNYYMLKYLNTTLPLIRFVQRYLCVLTNKVIQMIYIYVFVVEIAPRGASKSTANKVSVLEQDPSMVEAAIDKGGKKATLRLKQNGSAVVEEVVSTFFVAFYCKVAISPEHY